MSEPIQCEVKCIFPNTLRAKPYRVVLYDMETGWRDEKRTMIVDEARGLCKIEYEKTTVHNSHGTDVDYELYCSNDYTMEQMAGILEKEYSPVTTNNANAGLRDYYKQEAYTYASKLRESGAAFAAIQSAGKSFLHEHLPDCEITKLTYASSSTAVFEAVRQSGETVIVKMSRVPRARKTIVDSSFDRVMRLEGNNNLLPICGKLWFPLDTHHEVMILCLPLMETIGTERKNFSSRLAYKSIIQDKDIYGAPLEQRIHLAVELAKALKTLHENGLVHHDVKPENLFFKKSGNKINWYLGDFDSIKPVEQQYEGKTSGTLAYAAPEILEKKPFSFSSDVYSWGRTMFFLAHGDIPDGDVKVSVEVEGIKIRLHTNGSSCSWNDNDPRVLQFYRIIAKAMNEDPLARYASGKELLEALEKIHEAANVSAQSECRDKSVPVQQANQTLHTQVEPAPECKPQSEISNKPEGKTMERKIQWNSGCFDEIDLVYDKAKQNETVAGILSELETGALAEARAYSNKIVIDGRPITPQQFDALPDNAKEYVMSSLSNMGLSSFSSPITEPKITVRLSPHIQYVRCCTAFSILNRLEKLDGSFNMLHPTATLELQVPLGGKKGMFQIELLIMQLYPWLKVTEVSSNEVAVNMMQEQQPNPQQKIVEQKAPVPPQTPVQSKAVAEKKDKQPGFWARLFGKKK